MDTVQISNSQSDAVCKESCKYKWFFWKNCNHLSCSCRAQKLQGSTLSQRGGDKAIHKEYSHSLEANLSFFFRKPSSISMLHNIYNVYEAYLTSKNKPADQSISSIVPGGEVKT